MTILHTTAVIAAWEPIAPLPEPNGGFMAGCVDGKIIIAGGTNWDAGVKQWLDKLWVYDPATKHWSAGPSLPHPLAYAACASDEIHLYLAGGADGKEARKEVYALGEDLKLVQLGNLPHPIAFPGAALQKRKLFVLGGTPDPDDWSKATAELHAFNLADGKSLSLPPLTLLNHGVGIPAMAAVGNKLFAFTGAWLPSANGEVSNLSTAFSCDVTEKHTWHSIAPFPKAVRGIAAVALDEHRIYLAGGYGTDEEGFLSSALIYHADTNRYTIAPSLPFAACTTLVKCGSWIYVLGGEDLKKHRTAQCFRIRVDDLATQK